MTYEKIARGSVTCGGAHGEVYVCLHAHVVTVGGCSTRCHTSISLIVGGVGWKLADYSDDKDDCY